MDQPASHGEARREAGPPSGTCAEGAESRRDVEVALLEAPTLRDYLDDFAMRAGRHLGPGTDVSITLRHARRDRLAAASSERAARCDQVEHATGAGPCLTAIETMQVVLVPDIAAEGRWSTWRDAALDAGDRASAGLPAHVADGVDVALNLYSATLAAWDGPLLLAADTYAQQVATTVGLALQVARLGDARDDDEAALRELRGINRLLVSALTRDDASATELAARLRGIARGGTTDPEADVRAVIEAVVGTPRQDQAGESR